MTGGAAIPEMDNIRIHSYFPLSLSMKFVIVRLPTLNDTRGLLLGSTELPSFVQVYVTETICSADARHGIVMVLPRVTSISIGLSTTVGISEGKKNKPRLRRKPRREGAMERE